jgi:hypothetical protein
MLVAYYQSRCWNCGNPVRLDSLRLDCPIHHRPLCIGCSGYQLELIPVFPYLKRKHISPAALNLARLRTANVQNVIYAYKRDIVEAVLPHAEARKAIAYQALAQRKVPAFELESVRNFDPKWYYSLKIEMRPDVERFAAVLGKKGDRMGRELDSYIQPRLKSRRKE